MDSHARPFCCHLFRRGIKRRTVNHEISSILLYRILILIKIVYIFVNPSVVFVDLSPATDTVTGHAIGCAREQACPKLESIWTRKYGFPSLC